MTEVLHTCVAPHSQQSFFPPLQYKADDGKLGKLLLLRLGA